MSRLFRYLFGSRAGVSLESYLQKAERTDPALICQARRELRDIAGTRLSPETRSRLLAVGMAAAERRSALR